MRLGQNPAKSIEHVPQPQPVTVAVVSYIPFLSGYYAEGLAVLKACLESLVPGVERGGYIPFCDHRCPPNVRPDYYLYYLDLKEAMFGLH